jgi:regulator of ribosome biosynthesis
VLLTLPAPATPLPREKPLPSAREKTKWEKFAEKRGIKNKRKDGKLVYDEAKGEWVPKWGYKGKNKDSEDAWIVEVDEKKERALKEGQTIRSAGRSERLERIRRNERKQRANDRTQRNKG